MIDLNAIFQKDFDCEYDNYKKNLIFDNDVNEEINITKENEKIFTDGIEEYYKFINN